MWGEAGLLALDNEGFPKSYLVNCPSPASYHVNILPGLALRQP